MSERRVGSGFDVHRLVAGRPLMLGGIQIPFERGLAGHSDGDCLIHAVCDALLGAVAAGDMGSHFPSSDARWAGAARQVFLEQVAQLVAGRGFVIENLDATLVAEVPRLSPHVQALRASLARLLELDSDRVSVKVKSADGLGALGHGDGIAAHAVCLLLRPDTERR
jgi:2-C-methyl-D-erythritol 2,4-cyclodiphosphate synthase